MISGANRGIGAAIAEQLFSEGWGLSLGMRSPQRPGWAGTEGEVLVNHYDATAGEEDAWVAATLEEFGRVDAVVANAGIMIPGSVIEADDADLDAMCEINVKAPRRLAKAAWQPLKASGSGRVIIVASLSGKRVASPRSSLYSMTKYAAVALAHGLRREGWEHGIRATALCPGLVSTDMGEGLFPDKADDMTRPGDVARLAAIALDLPNTASVAELHVNCADGEIF
jgi:NAD(P)-dependent dehydrogenase (short-subunit alcohol dehydrogenase family)